MAPQLRVGTAKIDITPKFPLPLAGFAIRENRKFEAVDSRLHVRTFYFRQHATDRSKRQALLVSADILFWSDQLADRLRTRIARRWRIPLDAIILNATHTHSGPAISTRTVGLGEPDPDYLAFLEEAVIRSVEQAVDDAEPVSIHRGRGSCGIGVNRRKKEGDRIVLAPNEEGVTDPELRVFVFKTSEGKKKGVLAHYACHPTLSARNAVSSEFSGHAMEQLESHDSLTVCAYLQGCCGDINPARPESAESDRDAIFIVGKRFADDVKAILSGELERLEPAMLAGRRSMTALPFAEMPTPPRKPGEQALFEITKLTIADGLTFIAMNGEMVAEYGLFVKSRSPDLVPLAYSNGMVGYITTAEQLQEGGYEPIESVAYFGLPGPFDQTVEATVKRHLTAIINEHT